jgi:hypothetical protein
VSERLLVRERSALMTSVDELTDSVSPSGRPTRSSCREVLIGVRCAEVGSALAASLTILGVEAELDVGLRGFPATVHALVPESGRLAARQVLELAHYLDRASVRLPLRGAPAQSVHQLAPRVASPVSGACR